MLYQLSYLADGETQEYIAELFDHARVPGKNTNGRAVSLPGRKCLAMAIDRSLERVPDAEVRLTREPAAAPQRAEL